MQTHFETITTASSDGQPVDLKYTMVKFWTFEQAM